MTNEQKLKIQLLEEQKLKIQRKVQNLNDQLRALDEKQRRIKEFSQKTSDSNSRPKENRQDFDTFSRNESNLFKQN